MKKNIFNLLVISISLMTLLALILKNQGIGLFLVQLSRLKLDWVLLSLFSMFMYWFCESAALYYITLSFNIKKKFRESFSTTMVGQFFNSVTPFATGGQPAQVLYMMKNGMDTGNASSIVMIKFLVFQSVLTLYSLIVILFSYNHFKTRISLLLTMTVLGLAVHASMILLTILFSYNRVLTEKMIKTVFRILKKVKFIKIKDNWEIAVGESLSNFHQNAALLKNNPRMLLEAFFMILIQLTFFFTIPYCIYQSFGYSTISFFNLFSASVFVATIISIVPLPGAAGGAEGGFYLFFEPFFDGHAIVSAILIWRIITYYSCIGVGSFFTVVTPRRKKS